MDKEKDEKPRRELKGEPKREKAQQTRAGPNIGRQRIVPNYEDALSRSELRKRREEARSAAASGEKDPPARAGPPARTAAAPPAAAAAQPQPPPPPPPPPRPFSRAIADQPRKTPGGKVAHHCPRGKHGTNPSACLRAGCIKQCDRCGQLVSSHHAARRCLWCASEEHRRAQEEKAAQEAAKARAVEDEAAKSARQPSGGVAMATAAGAKRANSVSSAGGRGAPGAQKRCCDAPLYALERRGWAALSGT